MTEINPQKATISSNWTVPDIEASQIKDFVSNNNNANSINLAQPNLNNDQLTKNGSPSQPMSYWTLISPCLQGIVLGAFSGAIALATVLSFWLIPPRSMTAIIVTYELPPGTVILFSGNMSTLAGSTHRWLLCDGSEVSRITYHDLFDVIGVTYGAGNGNDTFNLPDFRTRFPLGSNDSNTQMISGGTSSHILTVAEMPSHVHDQGSLATLISGSHTHAYTDPGHNHGGTTGPGPFSAGPYGMLIGGFGNDGGSHSHTIPNGVTNIVIQPNGDHTHTIQGLTGPQGLGQPFDKMPPYQTVHYIIRA